MSDTTTQPTATRAGNCWRPMATGAPAQEVGAIMFYDADGVWLAYARGWLEHQPGESYTARDVVEINCGPARRARKLDFSRGDVFYIPSAVRGPLDDKRAALYLPHPKVEPVKVIDWQNEEAIHYRNQYTVNLPHIRQARRLKPDHEQREPGDKSEVFTEQADTITLSLWAETVNRPLGDKLQRIQDAAKAAGVDLPTYKARRLLDAGWTIEPPAPEV